MTLFRIEVCERPLPGGLRGEVLDSLLSNGLKSLYGVAASAIYIAEIDSEPAAVLRAAQTLLTDAISQTVTVAQTIPLVPDDRVRVEVFPRPGVMDPVAISAAALLKRAGLKIRSLRTGRGYDLFGKLDEREVERVAGRVLANDCIEELFIGPSPLTPPPLPPRHEFEIRSVPLRTLSDAELERLSRDGHLFLSLAEMRTIQAEFRRLGREPTDLELETLAQTWSEHCVHKTLKSAVDYDGADFQDSSGRVERRYDNLLKDTIALATSELQREGRGPTCLSVFVDNAGVIAFDDEFGVAMKVETHNHPSAIEPYGGAATGIGGCIRDVLGCGLGAKPIANTDVFCVAPTDVSADELPAGVLAPRRVLGGVVQGVADYGNRMGIPTVAGAIHYDARYLGNPLVFAGCVGLLPRRHLTKQVRRGDQIVLVGGRTGRDGIHGATFSSAELSGGHADEFSHAVQIGNPIAEKRCVDALLACRDAPEGCLYSAITDCGAGGLSSAVGEMGAEIGASVELERVPLKYEGLRYDEIWISEAQERMVLAVPAARLAALLEICASEELEATVIGEFGCDADGAQPGERPVARVRYRGVVVGELGMSFLHEGRPATRRRATYAAAPSRTAAPPELPEDARGVLAELLRRLARPGTSAEDWVIRSYDHEVQGGSVVKPRGGPGGGVNDAAVLRPRLDGWRGVAFGCGLAPELSEVDPYWMALNAIDEALRNVVAVGADPAGTALLDNFCWGRTDDEQRLGELVRACQACHDAALAYGTPFISGKDSLNNEFALDPEDVERTAQLVQRLLNREPARLHPTTGFDAAQRIRETQRVAIPATLLITAIGLVADVRRCVTADLKARGGDIYLCGGLPRVGFSLEAALDVHSAVARMIERGEVVAVHDVSADGWLTALAEMSIGGRSSARIYAEALRVRPAFENLAAGYVVQVLAGRGAPPAAGGVAPMRLAAPDGPSGGIALEDAGLSWEQMDAAWRATAMRS